jgi:hypothetical protein
LVVQFVGVFWLEGMAGAPPAAQALAFNGAVGVWGEEDAVVFVGFPQEAFGVWPLEVDWDAERAGDQVGGAVGCHLVGDVEELWEIFDRDVLVAFGFGERLDDRSFGGEQRAGEAVGLDALADVALEVDGVCVVQREAAESLGDDRSWGTDPTGRVALWDVDDAVGGVGDRAGGAREVLKTSDLEAVVGGDVRQVALPV